MKARSGSNAPIVRLSLLLIVAVGVSAYALWIFSLLFQMPSDRAGIFVGSEITVKQVALDSPLQVNDVILKIDGVPVGQDLLRFDNYWAQLLESKPAGAVYTVARGSETLRLYVPWRPYGVLALLWRGGALWWVGTAMVGTAIVLITGREQERVNRILAATLLMLGLNQLGNVLPAASANLTVAHSWLFVPLDALSVWLTMSLGLHTMLIFPEVKAPLQRYPALKWLLHIFVPVISLGSALLFGGSDPLRVRALMFSIANPLMLVELILLLAAMGHTYATSRRPGVSNQIRWIFWGISVAAGPWVIFYVLPSVILGTAWLPLNTVNVTLIFLPISFAIAVLRYGLMDIDLLINRTVVYGILTGALVLLYLLIVSVAEEVLSQIPGGDDVFWGGVIGTLALFLVFNPLRVYVQQIVDRTLFSEQLDFDEILQEISRELATTISFDDVRALLVEESPRRLGLSGAYVLLHDESLDAYISEREPVLGVALDSALVNWIKEHQGLLFVYQRQRFPLKLQRELLVLDEMGVEVCVPLFQYDRLLGLYLLGGKPSGNLLNREELNALVLLGHQAATALQNAQLYKELQEYNRLLEARVEARTSELRAERNRLDTILQNIADGLVVTDLNGRIVLANPAFTRIVDRSMREIVGVPLNTLVTSDDLCQLVSRALVRPGGIYTANIFGEEGVNGHPRYVYKASSCALQQTPVPGSELEEIVVTGVVTVLRDVTQEHEVDRMKTEFISTVSHELRTPLTSVLGFAKLIQKTFEREIVSRLEDEDRRGQRAVRRISDNLEIITSEGERLTRLINDVLDIAKMESGEIEWHISEVDFPKVVDAAVNAISALAIQKDLSIVVEVEEGLPPVAADRDRMIQVLTNLLSNAVKFTPEGQIVVRVGRLLSFPDGSFHAPHARAEDVDRALDPGSWLLVSVEDRGVGIAPEKLSDVFVKFKQVSGSSANRPSGTGLGLPICREIVERHGGQIWVQSTPGVGSTFSFVLPIALGEAPTIPVPRAARERAEYVASPHPGRRILIVDDEVHIRRLLYQELTDAGYQVIEAEDGGSALERVRSEMPNLIIMDILLPRISGFDVVSVLKGDPQTADIPIVFLTAWEERERGFRLGAEGYLVKPLDVSVLLEMIAAVLGRHRTGEVPETMPSASENESSVEGDSL